MSLNKTSEAKAGFSSPDAAMRMPRAFGRLLLLKLLARGGMGDVYLAATTGIEGAERPVVVKTVRRDHIHDGSFLARFLDEARVQSQLNHPGVAQVLEASTDENGEPFTVVEYVEGRSLSDVRQRAIQLGVRIGWIEAVAIAIEMATALSHVHERASSDGSPLGIVHRDLSPQNVMVGYAGEVKLIDFGTARGHNRKCHTVAGVVFAKPGYVAPEVARQQVGDGRIDIYALGIMLWELCAGRRFLTGDAQQHLEDAAAGKIDVPAIAKDIDAPAELDVIIAKMTENDPDIRYLNASMAASDLAKVLAGAPAPKVGERGVRARTQTLMRALWPHEPQRVRSEFAKLLKEARSLERDRLTPPVPKAAESAASLMNEEKDPSILAGTPYRISRTIGEGASGVVYEAEHLELGRRVALKVLAPEHASAKDSIDRFRREARSIAKLSHPNLCMLYDFGKSLDGRVFLAMELLSGETLERKLKRSGGMDWREALRISIEAARALEAAHGAGLVHRDLKPANLFLTKIAPVANSESRRSGDGTSLKLLDFGVAMALSDVEGEKRQKGFAIFGTPEYMAPEQVAGEPVDGRCDIYALGCVLYELITGTRPFSGGSSVVVMGKQLRETAESPRLRAPHRGIPVEVDAIVMKALAKKPDDRFVSAEEMRGALEAALLRPTAQQTKTRRMTAGVALLSCLIGVGAVFAHGSHGVTPDDAHQALHVDAASIMPAQAVASNDAVAEKKMTTHDLSGISLDLTTPNDPVSSRIAASTTTRSKKDQSKDNAKDQSKDQTKDAQKDQPVAAAPLTKDKQKLLDARTEAETHPEDAHALQAWANAAFKAGDFREARRATEAWSLRDGSPEPRIFLATVLDATGKRADARAVLEEVLDLHPDSTEARRLHAHYGAPLPSLDSGGRKSIAHR
ncbi:MAG: protein kinase [Polyangiaceae bacterium]